MVVFFLIKIKKYGKIERRNGGFMLKFAHISDIHLGYTSGNVIDSETKINLRELDGYKALEECLDKIIQDKEIKFVLCTGDFFHSPNPNMRVLTNAQRLLRKLTESKIPFYCLAGNHDATDTVKDVPANKALHIPELNLFSYVEPYKVVEVAPKVYLHLLSHHSFTAQKETMKEVAPVQNAFNVLCSHGSCYDTHLQGVLHSEAEPREVVIPEEILQKDWDYTLLGHIHSRGWVGSSDELTDTSNRKIFYGGSLFRRGFSDKECKLGRGYTKWTIDTKEKTMTPEFFTIKQRPQYDLALDVKDKTNIEIEDNLDSLLKDITDEFPIVRITLYTNTQDTPKINWTRFEDRINRFLSFHTKFIRTGNFSKLDYKQEYNKEVFSFDLFDSYDCFWKHNQNNLSLDIDRINKELLNKALDKKLEQEQK